MTSLIEQYNEILADDGEMPLETRWEVCGTCNGSGTSTAYLGAYTQSDREEMGDEWYEFTDDIRAGFYDKPCDECAGRTTVLVIDEACCSTDDLAQFEKFCRDVYSDRQAEAMERMMGA